MRFTISICLFICMIIPSIAQESSAKKEFTNEEKIYGLSLLWKEASYNFAYFDKIPEIDWDKTYQAYIQKVIETKSIIEYYDVLKQFLALLKCGHTRIFPPQEYREYFDEPKIKLINIQNRAIVKDVGESLKSKIPIGSYITKVNDIPINDYLKNEKFPYISCTPEYILWTVGILELLKEKKGTNIKITYITPERKQEEMTLQCNSKDTDEKWSVSGNEAEGRLTFKKLDNDLLYMALNTFTDRKIRDDFKQHLPEIQKCKGLIIDIRNNGGGDSDNSNAILKYLIEKPIITVIWKSREHIAVYKAWGRYTSELSPDALKNISEKRKKYLNHYKGNAWYHNSPDTIFPATDIKVNIPTVVLAGHMTASAAEDFLIGAKFIRDVVTIGEITAGFTDWAPLFLDLPGGGFALITTTQLISENGDDIIFGIKPDIEVQPTVQDIIENKDTVLEKGIEILNDMIK